MKARFLIALLALALVPAAAGQSKFKAALTADTHTPKVNVTWRYHVRVTDPRGKPIWARITVRIRDPLGTYHPVEFDGPGQNPYVKNYRFFGNFCDSVTWPPESAVGVTLKLQTVITTAKGKVVLSYDVMPQS